MYKKITIIEELKKEFVITSKGEELLIGLSRNIKKHDNWEHNITFGKDFGRKEERTTLTEVEDFENKQIEYWKKLDKINREEIVKLNKQKEENKKGSERVEPNFKEVKQEEK